MSPAWLRRSKSVATIEIIRMPSPCTEAEVADLVTRFYAEVRDDAILSPIFERHVADWSRHMSKMIAFWSTALCGSKSYRGNPMLLHRVLPDLTPSMFERWLDLFDEAANALPNRAMAERAGELRSESRGVSGATINCRASRTRCRLRCSAGQRRRNRSPCANDHA